MLQVVHLNYKEVIMKTWYWICEMIYKFRLKRAYKDYVYELDRYDCGHSLASYVNPGIEILKQKCDSLYKRCMLYKEKREKL